MRKFIFFVLPLFLTCYYANGAPSIVSEDQSTVNQTTLGPDGLGQLKLGMKWEKGNTVDQLVKFGQDPAATRGCVEGHLVMKDGNSNPLVKVIVSRKLGIILISSENITNVYSANNEGHTEKLAAKDWPKELRDMTEDMRSFSRSIHTPEGIGVGSTESDIKKVYKNINDDQTIMVPGNKNAIYRYFFDEDESAIKVGTIELILIGQDCFG